MRDFARLDKPKRKRVFYLFLIVVTIALGLATRAFPGMLPAFLGKYPGDALWALLVFFVLGCLFARVATERLAGLALAISWAVEFSQKYQADWIVEIRSYTLGHLVLGSSFHWPDLVAYVVGVGLGVVFEIRLYRKR